MQQKSKKKKPLRLISYVLSMFCFLLCIGRLSFLYAQIHKERDEIRHLRQIANIQQGQPDWEALQKQNKDIIGWLLIPDTNIDYPIVQGIDNQYYLTHNFLKEEHYARRYFS